MIVRAQPASSSAATGIQTTNLPRAGEVIASEATFSAAAL
jgi:hypothetical protein